MAQSKAGARRQTRVDLYRRWVGGFAAAGLVIPLALLGSAWLRGAHLDRLWSWLWPFVSMLQPVQQWHPTWSLREVCALLIGYNVLWYALLGAVFGTGHVLVRFMSQGWLTARD